VLSDEFESQLNSVKDLILGEVNIKELEILRDTTGMITKRIKADFKVLGKKLGKQMKVVAGAIAQFSQEDIATIERDGTYTLKIEEGEVVLGLSDVEISSDDIPGWLVATENGITVALDINLSEELRQEGIARELVNRIQNLRKDRGFEVTDRITLEIQSNDSLDAAINNNLNYICSETLAGSLDLVATISEEGNFSIDISDDVSTIVAIEKLN
jgi:isoleucyl-tRNA synthetase